LGSWPQTPLSINRLAIFAVFHRPEVTLSNLGYVNCLKEVGFQVVYVHNVPISTISFEKLRPLCIAALKRMNLGQDFGAYKDPYQCLQRSGWLNSVDWLLFRNDSLHFLWGNAGSSFSSLLSQKLSEIYELVLGLNNNLKY